MLDPENEQKISFWIKNFTTRQILNRIFRPVRLCNENCTKCHILELKKNASAFELKFSQRVRFWNKNFSTNIFSKKLRSKNHVSVAFAPWKPHYSHTFNAFWKASFWIKNFTTFRTSNQKFSPRQSFALLKKCYKNCSRCVPHINTWTVLIHCSIIESVNNLSPRVEKGLIISREEFNSIKELKVWTKCPELPRGGSRWTSIERI